MANPVVREADFPDPLAFVLPRGLLLLVVVVVVAVAVLRLDSLLFVVVGIVPVYIRGVLCRLFDIDLPGIVSILHIVGSLLLPGLPEIPLGLVVLGVLQVLLHPVLVVVLAVPVVVHYWKNLGLGATQVGSLALVVRCWELALGLAYAWKALRKIVGCRWFEEMEV